MILKASQRSHARELAHHLMNGDSNEHVTVHEVRGFISEDILGALEEAYAVSRGTQCKQFLFSLSLNPPEFADLPVGVFEDAIADIEKVLGLINQPRVIVFHDKNGRRHCHCVWSRIDSNTMTAINMAHYKRKLNTIAKALYLKHGWTLPKGFKKNTESRKENYNRAEWQQAQRLKENPEELKALLQKCWQQSDSRQAFAGALQEYGLYLAKGDKRGYVVVDYHGEVYSLSRWMKVKTKELKSRLGKSDALPSVQEAHHYLETRITNGLKQYLTEHKARAKEKRKPLVQELWHITQEHRAERATLQQKQMDRWDAETLIRSKRLTHGIQGLFDKVTGKYALIRALNERETKVCLERDKQELQSLVEEQFKSRRILETTLRFFRKDEKEEALELKRHIAGFINTDTEPESGETPLKQMNEQLTSIDVRIEALSGDLAMLQASLEGHMLSDSMRAKIRAIIERTKSALRGKYQQAVDEFKTKSSEEYEEMQLKMQKFFNLAREQEQLRQKQQELQKQNNVNKQLYKRISQMAYGLNGVPMHKVVIADPPLDVHAYRETLRYQSSASLVQAVKTKPPKAQVINAADLRKSTATVSEILKRAKTKNSPPPKAGQRKTSKPKPRVL